MDNKRSVGVTVVGVGLYLMSLLLSLHASLLMSGLLFLNPAIFFPSAEIRAISPFIILIVFFLLGKGVLRLRAYARLLVLVVAVPYLVIGTQWLLSQRLALDGRAYVAPDVDITGFSMCLMIGFAAQIFGVFLLIFLNRAQVKEQFKR